VAAFREAIRLQPDLPKAHYNLGAVLQAQGKWPEAMAAYREPSDSSPTSRSALQPRLRPADSRAVRRVVGLLTTRSRLSSKTPGWRYPSAQWVGEGERLAALEENWPPSGGASRPCRRRRTPRLIGICLAKRLTLALLYPHPWRTILRQPTLPVTALQRRLCRRPRRLVDGAKTTPGPTTRIAARMRRQAQDAGGRPGRLGSLHGRRQPPRSRRRHPCRRPGVVFAPSTAGEGGGTGGVVTQSTGRVGCRRMVARGADRAVPQPSGVWRGKSQSGRAFGVVGRDGLAPPDGGQFLPRAARRSPFADPLSRGIAPAWRLPS